MSKRAAHAKAAKKNLPHQPQHGQPVVAAADASALPQPLAKQLENLFHKHGKHDASHHPHQPAADASGDTYLIHSAAAADSGADNGAASGAVVSDASGIADPAIVLTGGTVGAVSPAEAAAAPAVAPAPMEAAPVVAAAPAGFGIPGALLGGLALAGLAAAAGGGGGSGSSSGSVSSAGSPTPAPTPTPTPTPVTTTPVTTTPTPVVTTESGGTTLGASGATTSTGVTVTPSSPGATVTGVVVSGISASCPGDVITVTATAGENNTYTFDATQFANGPLNVIVTEQVAGGAAQSTTVVLDKDIAAVSINGHEYLSAADVSAGTPLTIAAAANATITGVTVSGTDANGHPLTETATLNNGVYSFDATQFADGSITVNVAEQDANGNALPDMMVQLVKDTSIVTASGTPYLNVEMATADASLTVTADQNATISTVTVTGTDANGKPLTETATLDADGKFHFDATKFADGNLTVHVVENSNGATVAHDVTIIKDTSLPTAVSTETHLTLNDVDAHGQAALSAHIGANEHLTAVTVAGLDLNGQPLTETATVDDSGKIHFDAAPFADGTLTLMISAENAAGNQETNTLTLTKDLSIVTVGGDNVLTANAISNGTATVTITPSIAGGENVTINAVTITGVDANGNPVTVAAAAGDNGQYTFDASHLADGPLAVAIQESSPGCPAETEIVQLVKDTSLVHLDSINTLGINSDCGQIGNATLTINAPAGADITGVTVTGTGLNGQSLTETATVDANGQYHFDASQFANGSLTVSVTEQGVATPLMQVIGLNTATVATGPDDILNASEATETAALNIVAGAGEHLSDITSVTVTGIGTDGTQHAEVATLGDDGKFHFNAKAFEDGSLSVHIVENNGAGDHSVTIIKDTSGVLAGGLGLDADTATATAALNIVPAADQTIEVVKVTGVGLNGQELTETASQDTHDGKFHFDATQFADGQLHVSITEASCAGGEMEHTLSITKDVAVTPLTVTDGDTTVNDSGATGTTYNYTPDGDHIHLVATDHDVINLAGGNDTVHLDADPLHLQFAELTGNATAGSIDTLSLTTHDVTLDLSHYNTVGLGVLAHFEQINLQASGNQTVTLSAQDLFNEHSDLVINGNHALIINGDASDTVNISGLTQVAGSCDATGHASANGSYNLYTGSAVDSHGVQHQVDLLLQHSVTVGHPL